jgi:hypothetical protein
MRKLTVTPRQELQRIRGKIEILSEKYGYIKTYPPNLCDICKHFWLETTNSYFDGEESDWGCNRDCDISDWPDKAHCGKFYPEKNWQRKIEMVLIRAMQDAIDNIAPYGKKVADLKTEIDVKTEELKKKNEELVRYAHYHNMLEVLARIREGKNENSDSANPG